MHFFKKQKKSCFGCFLHCSRKSCSLCFLLLFFLCFPTCGFSFSNMKWRSWRMKMVAMLALPWWSWHEWMVVGVKGINDRAVLWRARPQVEMSWATTRGNRVEKSGCRVQNIRQVGQVVPTTTLTVLSLILGMTSPIMRFSNPNLKPSILSAMKIKEGEEVFSFNPTVTSKVY